MCSPSCVLRWFAHVVQNRSSSRFSTNRTDTDFLRAQYTLFYDGNYTSFTSYTSSPISLYVDICGELVTYTYISCMSCHVVCGWVCLMESYTIVWCAFVGVVEQMLHIKFNAIFFAHDLKSRGKREFVFGFCCVYCWCWCDSLSVDQHL